MKVGTFLYQKTDQFPIILVENEFWDSGSTQKPIWTQENCLEGSRKPKNPVNINTKGCMSLRIQIVQFVAHENHLWQIIFHFISKPHSRFPFSLHNCCGHKCNSGFCLIHALLMTRYSQKFPPTPSLIS